MRRSIKTLSAALRGSASKFHTKTVYEYTIRAETREASIRTDIKLFFLHNVIHKQACYIQYRSGWSQGVSGTVPLPSSPTSEPDLTSAQTRHLIGAKFKHVLLFIFTAATSFKKTHGSNASSLGGRVTICLFTKCYSVSAPAK